MQLNSQIIQEKKYKYTEYECAKMLIGGDLGKGYMGVLYTTLATFL